MALNAPLDGKDVNGQHIKQEACKVDAQDHGYHAGGLGGGLHAKSLKRPATGVYSYELLVRAPLLGARCAACDNCKALNHQHDHRPRRSTPTWLARVAAITLGPVRTGAPIVAIAGAKTGLDITSVIAVAA